mgnify:CR=1 FL=1|jgi:hypothetical protein
MDALIENRKSERLGRLSIMIIEEEPVGNIYFGLMHNESRNGLYFVSLSGFQPGTFINIKFDDPSPISNKDSCRARIGWSNEINGDSFYGYGTGAQFC